MAVLAGVLDAALLPRTTFGYPIMNYRWLWATGTFVLMLVLIGAGRWITARQETTSRPIRREFVAVALSVCVLTAVGNIPRSVQTDGADRYLVGAAQRGLGPRSTRARARLDGRRRPDR